MMQEKFHQNQKNLHFYEDDFLNNMTWQEHALKLYNEGTFTKTKIAEIVERPRSTVTDFLRGIRRDCETKIVESDKRNNRYIPETTIHDNSRILWISDLHAPWQHKNSLDFLGELNSTYDFTRIICAGDECDLHSLNMHAIDPDLPSAGDELKLAKSFMSDLSDLFPVMDILESNHTSLAYRRAFKAGISKGYMKSYNEIFDVPDTWVWHDDLIIDLPNGQPCYFCHGKSADGLKLSRNMACNVVQGHYHSKFAIQYWSNPRNLYWSMQAGCLIDDKSLAMAYNKLTVERPIIGTGVIIDSKPILEPMTL
jgi:hypothetical protein